MPRTYSTEFPDFVMDVVVPSDFKDTSWRNDVCPSFMAHGLCLWIDYKEPEKREMQGKRFAIVTVDEEQQRGETLIETDDWSEVIAKIAELTPRVPRY